MILHNIQTLSISRSITSLTSWARTVPSKKDIHDQTQTTHTHVPASIVINISIQQHWQTKFPSPPKLNTEHKTHILPLHTPAPARYAVHRYANTQLYHTPAYLQDSKQQTPSPILSPQKIFTYDYHQRLHTYIHIQDVTSHHVVRRNDLRGRGWECLFAPRSPRSSGPRRIRAAGMFAENMMVREWNMEW